MISSCRQPGLTNDTTYRECERVIVEVINEVFENLLRDVVTQSAWKWLNFATVTAKVSSGFYRLPGEVSFLPLEAMGQGCERCEGRHSTTVILLGGSTTVTVSQRRPDRDFILCLRQLHGGTPLVTTCVENERLSIRTTPHRFFDV